MTQPEIGKLAEDPRSFFAPFDSVVLVANSRDAAQALTSGALGERPLFMFFNRVYRILSQPFEGDCVLISRSSPVGASLVYRKELDDVLALLKGPKFHGILNVRARDAERLSNPEDFKGNDVAFLDLAPWSHKMYPAGRRMPSTGFAISLWLAEQKLGIPIYLAGFTGVREAGWRVFDAHDWGWEQIVLHIMHKKGLLHDAGVGKTADTWPVEAMVEHFEEITHDDIQWAAIETLSHRLGGTNRVIDHIYSALRLQLAVRDFFRVVRPRSRKARTRDRLLEQMNKTNETG